MKKEYPWLPPVGVWVEDFLPIVEGRCIPEKRLRYEGTKENGRWIEESRYPVPDPDYVDPEIYETETYSQEDKTELCDYLIICKTCGTGFIAYKKGEKMINFCPGCGKRLK